MRHDAVFHRVVQLGARILAVPAAIGTISAALQLLVQSRASTPVCQRYHFGRQLRTGSARGSVLMVRHLKVSRRVEVCLDHDIQFES